MCISSQLYLDYNALNGTIPDAFDGAPLLNLFQVDHVSRGRQLSCLRSCASASMPLHPPAASSAPGQSPAQNTHCSLQCPLSARSSQNQLSGSVPPSLAAARVMQELYINSNRR